MKLIDSHLRRNLWIAFWNGNNLLSCNAFQLTHFLRFMCIQAIGGKVWRVEKHDNRLRDLNVFINDIKVIVKLQEGKQRHPEDIRKLTTDNIEELQLSWSSAAPPTTRRMCVWRHTVACFGRLFRYPAIRRFRCAKYCDWEVRAIF